MLMKNQRWLKRVENIMGKVELAGHQYFLLFHNVLKKKAFFLTVIKILACMVKA